MNNTNEANIKFLSKPTPATKVYIAKEAWHSCKVTPAISAMKKSAEYLFK